MREGEGEGSSDQRAARGLLLRALAHASSRAPLRSLRFFPRLSGAFHRRPPFRRIAPPDHPCTGDRVGPEETMAASPSIRTTPLPPPSRVACVYGDSTPFPHEGNFIETIRHAVDCGVALLGAQHVIQRAIARAHEIDQARSLERAR